jgi:hypothetical protein
MNKDNAKDFLPLVQALVEGKTLQHDVGDGKWYDCDPCYFNLSPEQYRIKPEPRVVWLNEYACGDFTTSNIHTSETTANTAATSNRVRCVKFVECLE